MATYFNIRDFGAIGDSKTLDTTAIQKAVDAAHESGGGIVFFPAGTFASYTIHLKSNVSLFLSPGAVLQAAYPQPENQLGFDSPEESETGEKGYQDFGHSHFHNSLLYGENLENVCIEGHGQIDGLSLVGAHHIDLSGESASPFRGPKHGDIDDFHDYDLAEEAYQGNKAIALKNCRNVTLRDFTLFRGGHFALLATGVDNLTIYNLKVDTNRDAFDIDCCRNVRISGCSVNSPFDDAIVLKTSCALGEIRPCENITISDCLVSGFRVGSLLNGKYDRSFERATDGDGPTGRIKIGTESNGDFRNITITNCVFDHSRGLAFETVDGATIEDIVVSNLSMRHIANAPFFLRLGNRARGPKGTPVGKLRRVTISNITVSDADSRYASLIVGEPNHRIEDVTFSDIRIETRGGMSLEQIAEQPTELVNPFFLRTEEPGVTGRRDPFSVPERPKAYPEPSMFGLIPAFGFFIRHASRIRFSNVSIIVLQDDERPAFVLQDAQEIELDRINVPSCSQPSVKQLSNVQSVTARNSPTLRLD